MPDRLALGMPLVTRRDVCRMAVAASAATLITLSPAQATSAARAPLRFVVRDRRIPESMTFAASLARRGATILEVTDGLTALWQSRLGPLWHNGDGAVAGLTRAPVWECLAEMARGHGKRTAFAGRHGGDPASSGRSHRLVAPPEAIAGAPALQECGAAWPVIVAGLAHGCRAPSRQPAAYRTGSSSQGAWTSTDQLVSWVIA